MTTKPISREPTKEMVSAGISELGGALLVFREDVADAFTAMFDTAPSLNPWVSVKERLPTKGAYYQVWNSACSHSGVATEDYFDQNGFTEERDIEYWWDTNIMSIPRPE